MITNVLEYLESAANAHPEKVAFGEPGYELTYGQLLKEAKRIGTHLALKGYRRSPIAVFTNHTVKCLTLFLGVVYSGNFYVPIDSRQPKIRVQAILDVANPVCTVSSETWETQKEPADEELLGRIRREHLDTDPLYLMFTSGSTGVPKGVVIRHRSVIDMAEQFTRVFGFCGEDVFANQAPFDFDVSVKDIYNTLKNGASMYIVPQSMFSMPKRLVPYLNECHATTLIWAVSAYRILSMMDALKKGCPGYVKRMMFSGEVMPVKVLNYWRKRLGEIMYVNLYGPTEITCNCTYYILNREFEEREQIPIGQAFPNTEILLQNGENGAAGPGEEGEICVRGSCLAGGYYNNPEETARAFCQNPGNPYFPDLIYRTGDYGRYNERGELIFAARKDWQIKHMGHRIELSEIESAANAIKEVDACCCFYDKPAEKIVMVYQAREQCDSAVAAKLMESLPKYMCPNRYVWVKRIAMNQRGKIDRKYLLERYAGSTGRETGKYLCQEAIVLGSGTVALGCAKKLKAYPVSVCVIDTGDKPSAMLKKQVISQGLTYYSGDFGRKKKQIWDGLAQTTTPTLIVSAINPWIIPGRVLENPYIMAVNCHQALLPAHPGRNAEMWSVFEQDAVTGISWHIVSPEVDQGDILTQREMPLTEKDTAIAVFRKQGQLALEAFEEICPSLLMGSFRGTPQKNIAGRKNCQTKVLRYSWEVPGDGRLDLTWSYSKISAFLRAFDYGGLTPVKRPGIVIGGKRGFWNKYKIVSGAEEGDRICKEVEKDLYGENGIRIGEGYAEILRPEGRILLIDFYMEDDNG